MLNDGYVSTYGVAFADFVTGSTSSRSIGKMLQEPRQILTMPMTTRPNSEFQQSFETTKDDHFKTRSSCSIWCSSSLQQTSLRVVAFLGPLRGHRRKSLVSKGHIRKVSGWGGSMILLLPRGALSDAGRVLPC